MAELLDRATAEEYASWFRALADPSRVQIVEYLARQGRPMSVGELVAAVGLAQSTVSQHLKILTEVRFVLVEPVGTARHYRINERCVACFPTAADVVMGRPSPPAGMSPHRAESQAFFGARAATWDTKYGDDLPAYAAAVGDAGMPTGGVVVDVGCGTGRALPALRAAVGPTGTIVGVDLTPEMLAVARERARDSRADLVLADAQQLPLADATVDAIFAAGLVMHLPDRDAGLRELARITRPGGRLVLFHPSGRAALAARKGYVLRPDDAMAEEPLRSAVEPAGWRLMTYDDPPHRFLAIATRAG